MTGLTFFGGLMLAYSLVSRRLERTVLTGPMIFTMMGVLLRLLPEGMREVPTENSTLLLVAEVGLVMTLFTDAARVDRRQLSDFRALPLRLLSTGMLLTIALGAVLAWLVLPGLSFYEAAILAAVLAPTDAGLGQVIVTSPRVPARVRQSLNVEAGLNDGLAVPFLMLFLALATQAELGPAVAPASILLRFIQEQIVYGTLLGVSIGYGGGWLLGKAESANWSDPKLRPLGLVVLPIFCITLSHFCGASMFIAAFVCGMAVRAAYPEAGEHCLELTEAWGSLFNLYVFFLFGIFLGAELTSFTVPLLLYAVLSLTVIRMLPVAISMWGTGLSTPTVLFLGWFGPRGLASIVLGLVYLEQEAHLPGEQTMRLALLATVLLSVVAHGLSAQPCIGIYSRRLSAMSPDAVEHEGEK